MSTQLNQSMEGGQIAVIAIVVLLISGVLGFTMVNAVVSAKDEGAAIAARQHGLLAAESGLDLAIAEIEAGRSGSLGSAEAPIQLGSSAFYTVAEDQGDGTFRVHAAGLHGSHRRVVRARLRSSAPVFHHAIFAGNSSNDPSYVLQFEGTGADADDINGDVYSGGDLLVAQDADVSGDARARGMVSGVEGATGVAQPGFDFSQVDFTAAGIVDVAAAFASGGVLRSSAAGGTAKELPENHPAHIFRLNPSDRSTECNGTTKPDYFLEDPYEPVGGTSSLDNGSDNYMVTVADGASKQRQTYYIDGNLWIHSHKSYGFMLESGGPKGTQVTFIVKGNITFSDSFRIEDLDQDAVGFVALNDPDVPDSGNIYMGDPSFGTLKELHAFLYAENDFLDINLSAAGSKTVRILGSMTAGDKVAIERTYNGGHSKLTVDWDQRLKSGAITLPFLDTSLPGATPRLTMEAWVEAGWMPGESGGNPVDPTTPVNPTEPSVPTTPGEPTKPAEPIPEVPTLVTKTPEPVTEPWWTPEWDERKIEYDQTLTYYDKEEYYEKLMLDQGVDTIDAVVVPVR